MQPYLSLWLAALLSLQGLLQAHALINPAYTPVQLVEQSESIWKIEFQMTKDKPELKASKIEAIKGKAPMDLTFDPQDMAQDLAQWFDGTHPVVGIAVNGDFSQAAIGGASYDAGRPQGMLHIAGQWMGIYRKADGALFLGHDPIDLRPVWEGSSEMLGRLASSILTNPGRVSVPTQAGVQWAHDCVLGTVTGVCDGALSVDITGGGRPCLFILGQQGDRFFRVKEDGAGEDLTRKLSLASASRKALWTDLSADGIPDLVSWDGSLLRVYRMNAGPVLETRAIVLPLPECLNLSAVDVGPGGQMGVVAALPDGPRLITLNSEDKLVSRPLAASSLPAGPCLTDDFDADGLTDVVSLPSDRILFYKGRAPGQFDAPTECAGVRPGANLTALLVGDFDADGLPDILCGGEGTPAPLWNRGGGRFESARIASGELTRIGQAGVSAGTILDINNDGRQEFVLFRPNMPPQIFFNRGFFCFGYAKELEFRESTLPTVSHVVQGQQAGVAADFDGDGIEELAMVTADGRIIVVERSKDRGMCLSLTVFAAPKSAALHVTAVDGKRMLGVRTVAGGRPALFGKTEKGPLDLTWRRHDGSQGQKRALVIQPTRITLSAEP